MYLEIAIIIAIRLVLLSATAAFTESLPIVYTNFIAAKNNENRG